MQIIKRWREEGCCHKVPKKVVDSPTTLYIAKTMLEHINRKLKSNKQVYKELKKEGLPSLAKLLKMVRDERV